MDAFDQLTPSATTTVAGDLGAVIAELAKLPPLEYETKREAVAKDHGVRVSVLDREVDALRPKNEVADTSTPFPEIEAWPDRVDGGELVAEILETIQRFCILPGHSAVIAAFWVLHSHAHDTADISPILSVLSPEKRCGKSTFAAVIAAMAPKPMHLVGVSPAVIFRVIEAYKPTLVVDEGDTFLSENEEMRGLLNGGHNRATAYVWRCHGDDNTPTRFTVWAPKLIAMIGTPPDTVLDRSVVVNLRRKTADEHVDRFHNRRAKSLLPIAQKAARWVADNVRALEMADPSLPDDLNDRAQDNARALVAIADLIGGRWPDTLRNALVRSHAKLAEDEPASKGVLLLTDIQEILGTWKGATIKSAELVNALVDLAEAPWAEWRRGTPITARGVATILKAFNVKPSRDRMGRFYTVADFADAFARYLSDGPDTSDTSVTDTPKRHNLYNENNGVILNATCDAYSRTVTDKRHGGALASPIIIDRVTGTPIDHNDFA